MAKTVGGNNKRSAY